MKNTITVTLFIVILSLSSFTAYNTIPVWQLEENYEIKFTADEPSGKFKKLKGDITFDESDLLNSSFSMTVEVNSIETGKPPQNRHAVSDKWFDATKYPNITFTSSKISKGKSGFEVTGSLTIKDVTKEITFPFDFTDNTFVGSFNVDRLEYHVGTMKGMQKNASQNLKIDLKIPVKK